MLDDTIDRLVEYTELEVPHFWAKCKSGVHAIYENGGGFDIFLTNDEQSNRTPKARLAALEQVVSDAIFQENLLEGERGSDFYKMASHMTQVYIRARVLFDLWNVFPVEFRDLLLVNPQNMHSLAAGIIEVMKKKWLDNSLSTTALGPTIAATRVENESLRNRLRQAMEDRGGRSTTPPHGGRTSESPSRTRESDTAPASGAARSGAEGNDDRKYATSPGRRPKSTSNDNFVGPRPTNSPASSLVPTNPQRIGPGQHGWTPPSSVNQIKSRRRGGGGGGA